MTDGSMTTSARAKALEALERMRLRCGSHAKISNSPKDMQDWIDRDAEIIRQALSAQPSQAVLVAKVADMLWRKQWEGSPWADSAHLMTPASMHPLHEFAAEIVAAVTKPENANKRETNDQRPEKDMR